MREILLGKKSLLVVVFLLVILPLLIFVVGGKVRLRPKAGGGTDPRAMQPTTLIFPYVPYASPTPIGGDIDQFGCRPAAGYSWCPTLNRCVRPWEEPCDGGVVYSNQNQVEGGGMLPINGQFDIKLVLQNISYETSLAKIDLVSSTGQVVIAQDVQIPGLGQKEVSFNLPRVRPVLTPLPNLENNPMGGGVMPPYPYSGVYSAIVTSDKGIRGVAQIVQTGGGSFSSDSYEGYFKEEASKKWFFTSRLSGLGRNQTDKLYPVLALTNTYPMPATYWISVYSLEGSLVYTTKGVIPSNAVVNVSNYYSSYLGDTYGSVVVESDQNIFAQGVLKSDRRLSFMKGTSLTKTDLTVPFPFSDKGKCDVEYSALRPYCGVPTLLIFNPNLNGVRVELSKNGGNLGMSKELGPRSTMMYKMARADGDVGSYSIKSEGGGVIGSVVFESDVYWDTSFTLREPLTDQYFPLWARYKYPFNSTTELVAVNPTKNDVVVMVDYFDQFGQFLLGLEKTVAAFKKENYSLEGKAQYGSARVRGYLPGQKGPGESVPVLAYMVGGQEVKDSNGSMLAGDGAFLYQGVGYAEGGVFPPPTVYPTSIPGAYLGQGWNRLSENNLGHDEDNCVGTDKFNEYWRPRPFTIPVEPPISPPRVLDQEGMPRIFLVPTYLHCWKKSYRELPTPISMPIPSGKNYPEPIVVPPGNQVPIEYPPVEILPGTTPLNYSDIVYPRSSNQPIDSNIYVGPVPTSLGGYDIEPPPQNLY